MSHCFVRCRSSIDEDTRISRFRMKNHELEGHLGQKQKTNVVRKNPQTPSRDPSQS